MSHRREEHPDGTRGNARPDDHRPQAGGPDGPTDLPAPSWWASLRRTITEFRGDNLLDLAAGLTYYAVLAVFPALLVLISLLGMAGQDSTAVITENVSRFAPEETAQILTSAIENLQRSQATASLFGLVSLLLALWSASGYVAAFMRASNIVYDIPEGRPIWKTLPIRVGVTLTLVVLLTASVVMVVITGGLADRVGRLLGIGSVAVTVWDIAKWPVLLLIVTFMIGLLYWASPNAKRGFRWVSPGSVLAILIWLVASAGFAFYVANFGSYNKTYGSLAAVVIFLIWLWISNIAILLGEEFNAEIERGRAIAAGHPSPEEPYVELRDEPKEKKPGKASRRFPWLHAKKK